MASLDSNNPGSETPKVEKATCGRRWRWGKVTDSSKLTGSGKSTGSNMRQHLISLLFENFKWKIWQPYGRKLRQLRQLLSLDTTDLYLQPGTGFNEDSQLLITM